MPDSAVINNDPAARSAGVRNGELRYRTLFDFVPVAVYTTDADGVIQEYNRRAVELWGRTPKAKGEKFCGSFKIFNLDGTPMPHDECPMARVLQGEVLAPSDCEIIVEQAGGMRKNVIVGPRVLKNDQFLTRRTAIARPEQRRHAATQQKARTKSFGKMVSRWRINDDNASLHNAFSPTPIVSA